MATCSVKKPIHSGYKSLTRATSRSHSLRCSPSCQGRCCALHCIQGQEVEWDGTWYSTLFFPFYLVWDNIPHNAVAHIYVKPAWKHCHRHTGVGSQGGHKAQLKISINHHDILATDINNEVMSLPGMAVYLFMIRKRVLIKNYSFPCLMVYDSSSPSCL